MNDTKNLIYANLQSIVEKSKDVVIAWDGGPYTGLIWWLAYKDLGIEIPLVFLDNDKHAPALYSFIHGTIRNYNLKATIVKCETIAQGMEKLLAEHDTVLTASGFKQNGDIEGVNIGINPLPSGLETWNLLKTLAVPFYKERKTVLG